MGAQPASHSLLVMKQAEQMPGRGEEGPDACPISAQSIRDDRSGPQAQAFDRQ